MLPDCELLMSAIIVPPIRAPLTDRGGTAARRRTAALAESQTTREWYLFFEKLARGLGRLDSSVNQGTREERLATNPGNVPDGALWVETDRGVVYQVQTDADGEPVWVYLAGTMQALLADKPADLDVNDTGFLFFGTDYAHTWRWTGTAWEYAPGDRTRGEIAWFAANPGTGWVLCNGSATTQTTPTAGTAAFTTPNLIGAYVKGGSVYTGAVIPASGSVSGGTTDPESSHTHPAGGVLGTGAPGSTTVVQAGTGETVAAAGHGHAVVGTTAAGSAHTHTFGAMAVTGADPAHVDLLPYYRI